MAQRARRNDHVEVARKTAMLQEKIQVIDQDKKEQLLVQAALRDTATAGEILQTAIEPRGDNPTSTNKNDNQSRGSRKEQVIREALSHLRGGDRDELLLAAGLRHDATGGDIIQAAIEAQAGGDEMDYQEEGGKGRK
ncbi:hypothetical protein F5Y12DRAFT_636072 [Xylaria sp. FL1777]|nr:hypothetical protein F5Y12DRAFT_636072 [Xylaria sp. FL1777]